MSAARALLAWLAVFVALAAIGTRVPPMQSPDEHSHVVRGYLLAQGRLLLETPQGMSSGGAVDGSLLLFMQPYLHTIVTGRATKLDERQRRAVHDLRWSGKEHFFQIPGTGYYLPLVYLPQATGIALGQALDLTVVNSWRLARTLTMASCLALLAFAFRILRPPPLALALLLLPMTLFQMVAPTVDGLTTCAAVLALSLFMRGGLDPGFAPRWAPWVLAALLLLLATTRLHLLPLLALPFVLAWRRRSALYAGLGVAVTVLSAAWLAYAVAHTVDGRVVRASSSGQVALHYLTHPWEFLRVLWSSLTDRELATFYEQTFIGVLGWLDTKLPLWAYPALWAALAACATASAVQPRWRDAAPERAVLVAFGGLASAVFVFLALLVAWTPHPARVVEGVQGRYFIVPALALAYAAAARPMLRGGRTGLVLAALSGVLSLCALLPAIAARYH